MFVHICSSNVCALRCLVKHLALANAHCIDANPEPEAEPVAEPSAEPVEENGVAEEEPIVEGP